MSQTIDVKRYEELARQKQGEHRKFLAPVSYTHLTLPTILRV